MAELLRVRRPFSVGRRTYGRGQIIRSSDPVAKTHAHLLISVQDAAQAAVERATAAPGERRTITPAGDPLTCDCGFDAASPAGLASHQRSHEEN